jgi:hypothetical protein
MKKLPKFLVVFGLLTTSACIQIPTFPAPERDDPEGPGEETPTAFVRPEQGPMLASAVQEIPGLTIPLLTIPEVEIPRLMG